MGRKLGADVPYCMMGGTMLAKGIGEILTPLADLKKSLVLLVKPPINVSTQSIYEYLDSFLIEKHPDTEKMIEEIKNGETEKVAKELSNVMELATIKLHPVIRGIKEKMMLNGAKGAIMSGSGPTVFGIFDDYKTAKLSHDSFAKLYKDVYLTYTL